MSKIFSFGFWNSIARVILRNRVTIIIITLCLTAFLATQWKNMRFSYTEANLLPDDDEINLEYNKFLDTFGEEGNLIVIAVKDSTLFTPEKFAAWNKLTDTLENYSEIDHVISLGTLKTLEKFDDPKRFEMVPFIEGKAWDSTEVAGYKDELFNKLPFYRNLSL